MQTSERDRDDAQGETVTHTFTERGRFAVQLRVTDPEGNFGLAIQQITVGNTAPEIVCAVYLVLIAIAAVGALYLFFGHPERGVARQDLSNTQAEGLVEHFSTVLTDNGGTVKDSEYWGVRTLAYKINKNRRGHYALLRTDAPSAAVQEMERLARLHDDVMRVLTIKVDELETGPSVMMRKQERSERGERGPRGDRGPRRDRDEAPAGE